MENIKMISMHVTAKCKISRDFVIQARRADGIELVEDDFNFIRLWAQNQKHDPLDLQLLRLGELIRQNRHIHPSEQIATSLLLDGLRKAYHAEDLPGMKMQLVTIPRKLDEDKWVTYYIYECKS